MTDHLTFAHLGVAVPDLDAGIRTYRDVFGHELLDGPYDDPIQKVRVCFMGDRASGGVEIELVSPLSDDSPVSQILSKGIGAYHTCHEVHDLDCTIEKLRSIGCVLLGKPQPAVAFDGRRITWLILPTRQLVELLEKQ